MPIRRRILVLVLVIAAALVGFLLWSRDPRAREIRRIQTRLEEFARSLSFTDKDPPFVRLGYAGRAVGFFADPVQFDMTLGSRVLQGPVPVERLREGAAGLRATSAGLSIRFSDIAVDLDQTSTNASAHLTARIFFAGDNDYLVQEFRMRLEKSNADWRVREVRTVRTMDQ